MNFFKKYINSRITLQFKSERIPSKGCNVIAGKGKSNSQKLVFCAHIDALKNSPGALDDAAGIVTLLALAELLRNYNEAFGVEIIAFNGEDYYATPGQIQYLEKNKSTFNQILMAINLDDVGYFNGNTHYSFYECPRNLKDIVNCVFNRRPGISEGQSWIQGDHMIFVMNQRPALALTSEKMSEFMAKFCHTEKDTMDLADFEKLADLALGLNDLVYEISHHS